MLRGRVLAASAALGCLTGGALLCGLLVGEWPLTAGEVLRLLREGPGGAPGDPAASVLWSIRLPRTAAAFASGAVLAGAGVLFQAALRNPLAEPYTLGVASGGAFGAACAILLGLSATAHAAFAGSLGALGLVWLLGRRGDATRMVLAGVVVGSLLGAALTLLKALAGEKVAAIVLWLLGSFSGATWSQAALAAAGAGVCALVGLASWRELDILASGAPARSLGVDEDRVRLRLLLGGSLATSLVVSQFGVVGFVGLLGPHLLRFCVGPGHRALVPLSLVGGGALLVLADAGARILEELPVGVLTALMGGPLFCVLLWRRP